MFYVFLVALAASSLSTTDGVHWQDVLTSQVSVMDNKKQLLADQNTPLPVHKVITFEAGKSNQIQGVFKVSIVLFISYF